MKANVILIVIICMVLSCSVLVSSCEHGTRGADYNLTCRLDSFLHKDSVTLLVLEDAYNKLRVCGSATSGDGVFVFSGQIDGPHAALLRFDNDSTTPFYFVLEPGTTSMTLGTDHWRVSGSPLSQVYQSMVAQRHDIMTQRAEVWKQYLVKVNDSTLKRGTEQSLVERDSVLNDSLQNLMVQWMNRDDAVGIIIRQRFASTLDTPHQRQLK